MRKTNVTSYKKEMGHKENWQRQKPLKQYMREK